VGRQWGSGLVQFQGVDIDGAGVGEANGEEADAADVVHVHGAVGGSVLDVLQIDGDGVPSMGNCEYVWL
jgi:hypothetical protein